MIVKIHKVMGGKNLRTETITGRLKIPNVVEERLPRVGEQLIIFAKPLENDKAKGRMFNTSPIVNIYDVDEGRQIITESGSVYFIEPL